jgi:hypothetical protein
MPSDLINVFKEQMKKDDYMYGVPGNNDYMYGVHGKVDYMYIVLSN